MNHNEPVLISERLKQMFIKEFPNPESHPRRMIRAAEWLTEQARWHSELRLIVNRACRERSEETLIHFASWVLANPEIFRSSETDYDE